MLIPPRCRNAEAPSNSLKSMNAARLISRLEMIARVPEGAGRAFRSRIENLPFRLGLTSLWPGSFLARIPDRYAHNSAKAIRQSGLSLFRERGDFIHDNGANNCGDLTRFYLLNLIFEQVIKEGLQGDVAELGVYKGNTASLLARFVRSQNKTAYLFDTFQGFPSNDVRGIDADKKIEFADTSLDRVKSLVGSDHVCYVAGYFPESASSLPPDLSFCLVHLDCDLYSPMRSGLEYFYQRLVPGGFLILHDYSSLYWDGAERAIDEFLADKRERPVPIPDKSGTAVIRRL